MEQLASLTEVKPFPDHKQVTDMRMISQEAAIAAWWAWLRCYHVQLKPLGVRRSGMVRIWREYAHALGLQDIPTISQHMATCMGLTVHTPFICL